MPIPRKLTRATAGCELQEVCDHYTKLGFHLIVFLKIRVFPDEFGMRTFLVRRSQL
jgi:hypothetical protein